MLSRIDGLKAERLRDEFIIEKTNNLDTIEGNALRFLEMHNNYTRFDIETENLEV